VSDAAEILRVTEDALRDWIATDRISYVTLPGGEHRLELIDEWHSHSGPVQQGMTMIKTGVGKADEVSSEEFRLELARRRREKQLIGVDAGEIDVDALAAALAERLATVVPSQLHVSAESGMIHILNDEGHGVGIDVAAMANDDGKSLEERVCRVARHALEAPQDWIADETTEPWPARAGDLPGGFPAPNAEIAGEQVRLYYGDSRAPILELAPIRLRDVRSIAE
jgi:hypothetical protein